MLRHIVNPSLAREVELDRPADGWPERIFRFSLFFCCASGIGLVVLRLFLARRTIESDGGPVGVVVGVVFGVCFFYMLNYIAWRFVKNRFVRMAWWSLISLIAVMAVIALSTS